MAGYENETPSFGKNKAGRKRERPDNSHEQSPKKARYSYSKQAIRKDDKAYAAGRNATKPRYTNHGPPVNELKSKIRDTKRSLERLDDSRPDLRIEKERALQGYERELVVAEERRTRSAMISKYHFVRFLERKTATKALKRLLREKEELENEDENEAQKDNKKPNPNPSKQPPLSPEAKAKKLKEIDSQISTTHIDINYAIYCPLTEKYISLYPNSGRPGDNDNGKAPPQPDEPASNIIRSNSGEKPPLWYTVKQSMKDGTLDLLRDGKLNVGVSGEKNKTSASASAGSGGDSSKNIDLPVLSKRSREQNKLSQIALRMENEGGKKVKGDRKNKKGSQEGVKESDEDSDGGFFEE